MFGNIVKLSRKSSFTAVVSAGIAIAAVWAVVFLAIKAHENRPTERNQWPTLALSAKGVKVDLTTQWGRGLRYELSVQPVSSAYQDSFDVATRDLTNVSFTFLLLDKAGRQVCEVPVPSLNRWPRNTSMMELDSNGQTSLCAADKYRQAASWNLRYEFPTLATRKPEAPWTGPMDESLGRTGSAAEGSPSLSGGDNGDKSESSSDRGKSEYLLEGDDTITGYDFLGHLTTQDGEFYIPRSVEQVAANAWSDKTEIRFKCDIEDNCSLQNLTSGGVIHARRIR